MIFHVPRLQQQPDRQNRLQRSGKVLVLLAISLPMLFGILGLVVDGGMLMIEHRQLQQVADAAATAAADELIYGDGAAAAVSTAQTYVTQYNGMSDATVTVNIPPTSGAYAGNGNYVEVILTRPIDSYFIQVLRDETSQDVRTSAVAGGEDATAGAAIVVLDPDPPGMDAGVDLSSITAIPAAGLGGLEVLGLGQCRIEGAVLDNNEWSGIDENGGLAGLVESNQYAASCTPILPLTKLLAEDIRVTGGVDNPNNYGHINGVDSSPLEAGRRAVPDPLRFLPVPTTSADSTNISAVEHGGVSVIGLPLLSPPVTLEPGVYEWIQITSGRVIFNPGVYIIRNTHPVTGIALNIVLGQVVADGVMFYFTDSAAYSPSSGTPDSTDGETVPPIPGVTTLLPTVLISNLLLGSHFSGLDDPGSPFDGMLFYQRRLMREPMVIAAEQLLGNATFSGTIYAKWGAVMFVGIGTYDLRIAAGSLRIVNLLQCTFAPAVPFPPAQDIFLVE